jgi:hypothetical protein
MKDEMTEEGADAKRRGVISYAMKVPSISPMIANTVRWLESLWKKTTHQEVRRSRIN